jgi:hypothetical protein
MINSFRGNYRFLSNFYLCPIVFDGLLYSSSEAAFQSAKTLNMETRKEFCELDPKEAKLIGRDVQLREDWNSVKDEMMYNIVKDKFLRNSDIRQRLSYTINEELVEGNDWNDTYWGVCNGIGQNKLGKILMRVRKEIVDDSAKSMEDYDESNL